MAISAPPPPSPFRPYRRPFWATVLYLASFSVLIVIVANYFLFPAIIASHGADASGRRQLSAVSALLLAVVLTVLLIGLLLAFRIHRFFFPRGERNFVKTEYVDAWAEAGKRAK
jgi:hypothetical protein